MSKTSMQRNFLSSKEHFGVTIRSFFNRRTLKQHNPSLQLLKKKIATVWKLIQLINLKLIKPSDNFKTEKNARQRERKIEYQN